LQQECDTHRAAVEDARAALHTAEQTHQTALEGARREWEERVHVAEGRVLEHSLEKVRLEQRIELLTADAGSKQEASATAAQLSTQLDQMRAEYTRLEGDLKDVRATVDEHRRREEAATGLTADLHARLGAAEGEVRRYQVVVAQYESERERESEVAAATAVGLRRGMEEAREGLKSAEGHKRALEATVAHLQGQVRTHPYCTHLLIRTHIQSLSSIPPSVVTSTCHT
jgi:chromosome segregation ATPase